MLFAFVVGYILLLYRVFKFRSRKLLIEPLFWLFASWGLMMGLYYTSGIDYAYRLSLETWVYLLICWIVFLGAYFIGESYQVYLLRYHKSFYYGDTILSTVYYRLSLFCFILWMIDLFRLNRISFGYRIAEFSISKIGAICWLFVPLSIIVWLFELACAVQNNKRIPPRGYISALVFIIPAIVTAGRQALLIFLLSTFIVLGYSLNSLTIYRHRKAIKIIGLIALIFVGWYLVVISTIRSGTVDKVALLEFTFNSKTPEMLVQFVKNSGGLGQVFLDFVYYYSHEVPGFEIFYRYYDGPLFWGMFQMPYIGRRLPIGTQLDYDTAWAYLDMMAARAGIYSHTWRTAISSFIIDFGRVGTVFFIGLLGFAIGKKRKKFMYSKTQYELVFLSLICVGGFFSVQYSPFTETSWAYPLYWLIVIPIIETVLKTLMRGRAI